MTGGTLRGSNYALVGSGAEQSLQGLRVSRAFLSGSGLTAERGLSTSNMLSASVDRALVQAAAEVVVLADHTKLGTDTMFQTVPTDVITRLVTDEPPGPRRPRGHRAAGPGRPGRADRRGRGGERRGTGGDPGPARQPRRDVPLPGPRRSQARRHGGPQLRTATVLGEQRRPVPGARAERPGSRTCGAASAGTYVRVAPRVRSPSGCAARTSAGLSPVAPAGTPPVRPQGLAPARLQAAQRQRQQAVRQLRVVRGLLGRQRDRVGELEQVADGHVGAYACRPAAPAGAGRAPASRMRAAAPGQGRGPSSLRESRHQRLGQAPVLARVGDDRRAARPPVPCRARAASSSSRERASRSAHGVLEDRAQQGVPVGEVAVERADAHARPAGDVLQRGVGAVLGEGEAGLCEQAVVVAAGVGTHRAGPCRRLGRGGAHLASRCSLRWGRAQPKRSGDRGSCAGTGERGPRAHAAAPMPTAPRVDSPAHQDDGAARVLRAVRVSP